MTSEQRLDRIERIAKLFVTAGLRARRNMRELDEKIGILINLQIQNEERFKDQDGQITMLVDLQRANQERFKSQDDKMDTIIDLQRSNEQRFQANEERFQANEERFAKLVESQSNTDRRLEDIIEIIRKGRNGNS